MVKTDDYMLMEDGAAAVVHTTTAEFVSRAATKAGGADRKVSGELMDMEQDGALLRHTNWLPPRSKSASIKFSSADYDESDESGGDQNTKAGDRTKFTPSIDSNELDDRRLRRQIANCNERRRMQSINAGFQALRQLLPRKDGDKMSKAAILAATAEFIQSLLQEKEEHTMAKKPRLDTNNQDQNNGILAEKEPHANVVDCWRTIGELRNSLQKETQLRMAYEKELLEVHRKYSSGSVAEVALHSPPVTDFSPISSSSSSSSSSSASGPSAFLPPADRGPGLLIELARQQQQQEVVPPQLYRPTPIIPSEVQILSSAIASLAAKTSPGAGPGTAEFRQQFPHPNNPIGINHSEANSLFVATAAGAKMGHQPQRINNELVIGDKEGGGGGHPLMVGQQPKGGDHHQHIGEQNSAAQQPTTISQRNLQALVLAIRHLEGANGNSVPGRTSSCSSTSAASANLLVQ